MVHGTVSIYASPLQVQKTSHRRLCLQSKNVTRSNPKFRLSEGPVSIRFNDKTAFDKGSNNQG
ncbi:hypothetical protein YC2023_090709 [Brassica napus]